MSKIITTQELANRSLPYLRALYHVRHEELVRSRKGSVERRNALASLENISRAIARTRAQQAGPRF